MEMVGHEAVRQTSERNALLRLAKHLEERPVVSGLIEEPKPADASIQDVKDEASGSDSPSIWHGVAVSKFLANIHGEMAGRKQWKLQFPFFSETTPEVL